MHQRYWTPAEDAALREALFTARSGEEIEQRVGRTLKACHHRCIALGWPPPGDTSYRVRSQANTWKDRAERSAKAAEGARPLRRDHLPPAPTRARPAPGPSAHEFEEGANFPPPGEPSLEEDLEHLVSVTRKPRGFEEVCDELDLSPRATRELIDEAQKRGYRIELAGMQVGQRPTETILDEQIVPFAQVDQAGEGRKFAAIGDVHIGSKHFMRAQFLDFVQGAYAEGVRMFLQGGDLLDGVYRHSVWEQSQRGFEEQVAEAIRVIPRQPGAVWHFIQGNHDETFGEQSGIDVGRAIVQAFKEAGRDDLVYHGARAAYLRLKGPGDTRGLLVEMWHPRDRANAYALSYRCQRHIEKYAPGAKPDVLLAFHWHQTFCFEARGVYAVSCGCWQNGQSSFGKSLGGAPSIGSWIIDYSLTEKGTVRRFRPEWRGYQEVEVVRDVNLG